MSWYWPFGKKKWDIKTTVADIKILIDLFEKHVEAEKVISWTLLNDKKIGNQILNESEKKAIKQIESYQRTSGWNLQQANIKPETKQEIKKLFEGLKHFLKGKLARLPRTTHSDGKRRWIRHFKWHADQIKGWKTEMDELAKEETMGKLEEKYKGEKLPKELDKIVQQIKKVIREYNWWQAKENASIKAAEKAKELIEKIMEEITPKTPTYRKLYTIKVGLESLIKNEEHLKELMSLATKEAKKEEKILEKLETKA